MAGRQEGHLHDPRGRSRGGACKSSRPAAAEVANDEASARAILDSVSSRREVAGEGRGISATGATWEHVTPARRGWASAPGLGLDIQPAHGTSHVEARLVQGLALLLLSQGGRNTVAMVDGAWS